MRSLRAALAAAVLLNLLSHAALAADSRPEAYIDALRVAGVPIASVGLVIEPIGSGPLRAEANRNRPMNPASTMKLLTTYSGLHSMGPAYTWHTDVVLLGVRQGDVVMGDLALRGSGDPSLVAEKLWMLVQRLRGMGLREIRGDLVLDRSAFQLPPHDPGAFDGDTLRTYNVGPDALLLNFKAMAYQFIPDAVARRVDVAVLPPLSKAPRSISVKPADGGCGDWQSKVRPDFSRPFTPVFRGSFPLSCGERTWHLSPFEPTLFFEAVFREIWEDSGGIWTGTARDGIVPPNAQILAVHDSDPLAQVVRDINKYSNNVMAQQLFLTFGAERLGGPATFARSIDAMRGWLEEQKLPMPELVLENGCGLSRVERISADSLARMLKHAYESAVMPEFIGSLPITGVDGTTRRRKGAVGAAHVKTGLLNDTRAVAGYVFAKSGRRYVVVSIVNHPNAGGTQRAQDALLEWVREEG